MKIRLLCLLAFLGTTVFGQEKSTINDWENPEVFKVNRESARATFLPFADEVSAISDSYSSTPWYFSLNGNEFLVFFRSYSGNNFSVN